MGPEQDSDLFPALAHARLLQRVTIERRRDYRHEALFYLVPETLETFWVQLKSGHWMLSLDYPYHELFSRNRIHFLPSYLGIVVEKPEAFIPPLIRQENPIYAYDARIPYMPDSQAFLVPNGLPYRIVSWELDTTWAKEIHPDQFSSLYLVMEVGVKGKNRTEDHYYFFPLQVKDTVAEGIYVEGLKKTPSEIQVQLRLFPFPLALPVTPILTPPSAKARQFFIDVINRNPIPLQKKAGYAGYYPFPCNGDYTVMKNDKKWSFYYATHEDGQFYLHLLLEDGVLDRFCLAFRLDAYETEQERTEISLLNPFPGDKSPLSSVYQEHYSLEEALRHCNVDPERKTISVLLRINQYETELQLPIAWIR